MFQVIIEGERKDGSNGQFDQICNARLPRGLDPHSVPSEELAASLGYSFLSLGQIHECIYLQSFIMTQEDIIVIQICKLNSTISSHIPFNVSNELMVESCSITSKTYLIPFLNLDLIGLTLNIIPIMFFSYFFFLSNELLYLHVPFIFLSYFCIFTCSFKLTWDKWDISICPI